MDYKIKKLKSLYSNSNKFVCKRSQFLLFAIEIFLFILLIACIRSAIQQDSFIKGLFTSLLCLIFMFWYYKIAYRRIKEIRLDNRTLTIEFDTFEQHFDINKIDKLQIYTRRSSKYSRTRYLNLAVFENGKLSLSLPIDTFKIDSVVLLTYLVKLIKNRELDNETTKSAKELDEELNNFAIYYGGEKPKLSDENVKTHNYSANKKILIIFGILMLLFFIYSFVMSIIYIIY